MPQSLRNSSRLALWLLGGSDYRARQLRVALALVLCDASPVGMFDYQRISIAGVFFRSYRDCGGSGARGLSSIPGEPRDLFVTATTSALLTVPMGCCCQLDIGLSGCGN